MSNRLLKELHNIEKSRTDALYRDFLVGLKPLDDSNLFQWQACLKGPPDTPYEGYTFKLHLDIPSTYPLDPPTVRFFPKTMPHCNVEFSTGRICLNILDKENWTPVWDLLHIVTAIYQLLQAPEPQSPLNIDLANIYKSNDTLAYYGLIRYYLQTRAIDEEKNYVKGMVRRM